MAIEDMIKPEDILKPKDIRGMWGAISYDKLIELLEQNNSRISVLEDYIRQQDKFNKQMLVVIKELTRESPP